MRKICDFYVQRSGIYQPFQDALHNNSTLKCERESEVFLFLVSLKCSRFYPDAHCSPTCGAYILSQRSFSAKGGKLAGLQVQGHRVSCSWNLKLMFEFRPNQH